MLLHSHVICAGVTGKQVTRQMFLLLAVKACTVYCMTNIGIQPDNAHTIDAVHSGVTFIIVKVSLCY